MVPVSQRFPEVPQPGSGRSGTVRFSAGVRVFLCQLHPHTGHLGPLRGAVEGAPTTHLRQVGRSLQPRSKPGLLPSQGGASPAPALQRSLCAGAHPSGHSKHSVEKSPKPPDYPGVTLLDVLRCSREWPFLHLVSESAGEVWSCRWHRQVTRGSELQEGPRPGPGSHSTQVTRRKS